jgi:hypothetical protein
MGTPGDDEPRRTIARIALNESKATNVEAIHRTCGAEARDRSGIRWSIEIAITIGRTIR